MRIATSSARRAMAYKVGVLRGAHVGKGGCGGHEEVGLIRVDADEQRGVGHGAALEHGKRVAQERDAIDDGADGDGGVGGRRDGGVGLGGEELRDSPIGEARAERRRAEAPCAAEALGGVARLGEGKVEAEVALGSAALGDGAVEEPSARRARQVAGHAHGACRLPKERHRVRVAAEM